MEWLKNRLSALLDNLLWFVLALAVPALATLIFNIFTRNTQLALLVLLVLLAVVNIIIEFVLLKQGRDNIKKLDELLPLRQLLPTSAELPPSHDLSQSPESWQARNDFEITSKYFDETSSPQKLIVTLTNRGSDMLVVNKVKYSGRSFGIEQKDLLSSYRKEGLSYLLDANRTEVAPGHDYVVEICLAQTWKAQNVNSLIGSWGYLHIEAVHKGKPVEIFNAI